MMGFFWLLAAIFLLGGLAKGETAWLLVAGAVAIVAVLLSILELTRRLVERGRR